MIITSFNPETDDLEKSYLNKSYSLGATSLEVQNNDGYASDDRLLIGEMGGEKTEVVTCSAVSADGTTITTGATVYSHEADTPVYRLRFDQVRFYRSTTGETGTYTLLDTVDMDVDNANLQTLYDDSVGTASYYYKITLYHSVSTLESDYSDPIGGSGWLRNQVGYVIDACQQETGDTNEAVLTRSEMLGYFNDVNDDITTFAAKPPGFLKTREALARTASLNYLDYPTDSDGNQKMWKFDRMDYNYTDSTTSPATNTTYTLKVLGLEEFRNKYTDNTIDSSTVSDYCLYVTLDDNVSKFRYYPPSKTTSGAVFYLYYWKYFDAINSEGDKIETPTPRIYKLYIKSMYYRKRALSQPEYLDMADRYMADYVGERSRLISQNRKDAGTPRGFRVQTSTYKTYRSQ